MSWSERIFQTYSNPLLHDSPPRLFQASSAHGSVPLSLVGDHEPIEPGKVSYAHASADPNRTTQFLVAELQVPFVCSETQELGEELVGSYLYQVHLYHWLESTTTSGFLRTTISKA